MADRRMVGSEIAEDVALNRASVEAQLMYLMTLPHLDRDGLVTGIPQLLWAKVVPLRVELMDKAGALVDEWVSRGLAVRYPGADGPVLFFPLFRQWNSNMDYAKEKQSRFGPPPGWVRTFHGLTPADGDAARRMAEQFKSGSHYHQALLGVAAGGDGSVDTSGGSREKFGRQSGNGREVVGKRSGGGRAQDQSKDQDQDQDQDQQGGGGGFCLPLTLLDALKDDRARARGRAVALGWMGQLGWKRREAYVDGLGGPEFGLLLAWLWAYQVHEQEALKWQRGWGEAGSANLFTGVEKIVGFMRWNVVQGYVPELLAEEFAALEDVLADAGGDEAMEVVWMESDGR